MRKTAVLWWVRHHISMLIAVTAVSCIAALLVFTQLGSLLPGANKFELQSLERLAHLNYPWRMPINYPFYLLAKIIDTFVSSLLALRITAALLGLATAGFLSYTLRQWFSSRIAIAGTLFIVTSGWYLQISRVGAPIVLSAFWLALLLAVSTYRTYTTKPFITDCFITVCGALSLYTPYYGWLAIISFILLAVRRRRSLFILPRRHQWGLPLIALALLAPLIFACIKDSNVYRMLLGIDSLPTGTINYLEHVSRNIAQIFFRGTAEPALNLGRLPLLDIFSAVMFALGIYYFERRLQLKRSQLLFSTMIVVIAVISFTAFSISKLAILFPIVMLFSIGGIIELLERWLGSFPRNPIARSVGVCVMVVAIGFTSFYHLQRYFVAWANNPAVVMEHKNK